MQAEWRSRHLAGDNDHGCGHGCEMATLPVPSATSSCLVASEASKESGERRTLGRLGLVAHSGDARLNGAIPGFKSPQAAVTERESAGPARRGWPSTPASGLWSHGLSSAEPTPSQVPRPPSDHANPGLCILGTECMKGERRVGSNSEQIGSLPPRGCVSSLRYQSSRHLAVVRPEMLEGRRVWSNLGGGARRDKRRVDDAIGEVWGNRKTAREPLQIPRPPTLLEKVRDVECLNWQCQDATRSLSGSGRLATHARPVLEFGLCSQAFGRGALWGASWPEWIGLSLAS